MGAPPSGGFVVAPNHVSHVDPLSFAHYLYDSGHPPSSSARRRCSACPSWARSSVAPSRSGVRNTGRRRRVPRAAGAVESGKCVGVYPEGTLTRDPGLWPMVGKTGAGATP